MQPTSGTPPDAAAATPPRRGRARLFRLLRLLLGTVVVVIGLAAAILLALQSPAVGTRVVLAVLGRVELPSRATMTVREVRGNWIHHLEFDGFRLARGETLLVAIDTLRVRHDPRALLAGHVDIAAIEARGVTVTGDVIDTTSHAPTEPQLSVGDLLRGRFYKGQPLRLRELTLLRGRFVAGLSDSLPGMEDVELALSDGVLGDERLAFTLDRLALRSASAEPFTLTAAGAVRDGRAELSALDMRGGASQLSGKGAITTGAAQGAGIERLELTADARPLALADLRTLAPGLDLEGDVTGRVALAGARLDALDGTVEMAAANGARVDTLRFGASQLTAAFAGGRADVTLRTVHEQAPVAVTGWVRPLDSKPTYDLAVRADRLPRRLSGVPAWGDFVRRADFATTARVRGEGFAPARFDIDATVRGAAGRATLAATVDTGDSLRWEVRRLAFDDVDVARLAGQAGPSGVSGTATARGRGSAGTFDLALRDAHFGDARLATAQARLQLEPDGRFRVQGGRFTHLTLEDSDLSGRFDADGRGGKDLVARAQLTLDPSVLRGQPLDRGELTAKLAGGRLDVDGLADSPAGRIVVNGHARPFEKVPSYEVRQLEFADLDVGAWTGGQAPRTNLTGALSAQGRGTSIATGALHLERSTIEAVTLDGADGRFDLADGLARANLDVRTAGGTAVIEADARLQADSTTYHATGEVPFGVLAHLLGRDSLESEGTLQIEATGRGAEYATAQLSGRGRIDRARVDSLEARLDIESNMARLTELVLISNVLEARGTGQVALSDSAASQSSDLRLTINARDLEPLGPLLGLDSLRADTATVVARIHGLARRPLKLEAIGTIRGLYLDGMRLAAADLVAAGTLDDARRLDGATVEGDLRRLWVGSTKVQDAHVEARWADGQLRFDTKTNLDATHRLELAGTAVIDSATTHLTLEQARTVSDSLVWTLVRPARFDIGADRYAVDDFEATSDRGVVKARGVVDRRGEQNLDVELRGVGLDFLAAYAGRSDLGGTLDGTLELRGSAQEPRARGDLKATIESAGKSAGTLTSNLAWDGRRLELTSIFAPPTGDSLTLAGHLPLAVALAAPEPGAPPAPAAVTMEGDVDLRLTGRRIALAAFAPFFDPRQVGTPTGMLDADLRLAGPHHDVAGSGYLTVEDAALELPVLGVTYRDGRLRIELEQDRILLREAHVASKNGEINAEGTLKIASLTRVEPDLRVRATRFEAINTPDLHVIASGDVTVTGRLLTPVVRGTGSVRDTDVYLTQAMTATAAAEVELTPEDIRMLEQTFGPITAKEGDPVLLLYDASDLDLEIQIERNTWIRQRTAPRLALELAGKVRLKKAPRGEAELYGRIAPVPGHGYVEQFARRFDFTGGEIQLNGPVTSHVVDIQTSYTRASSGDAGGDDVVVKLDVTGRVDELKLTLSSEPAMSPTEIISYIATGQTRSEMAADPGNSATAGTLAAQTALAQVTGQLEDVAQDAIGLDVVQIRQDAVQGATLVAGRYINPKLYVGFRQPVQYQANDNTSTSTSYRTQVEVEYEAYQWLLLNLQGEASEVNSFIRVRRAY